MKVLIAFFVQTKSSTMMTNGSGNAISPMKKLSCQFTEMKETMKHSLRVVFYLNRLLLVLFLGFLAAPAVGILSDNTGQIEGQAPTVTGNLQVLLPDGKTELVDNAMLGVNQIPGQFRVSSSTEGLELQDADGDAGLSAVIDTQSATLTWKLDGTELTSAQLSAPFGDDFLGQTLTLDVSAPVTASSESGKPTMAEPQIFTRSYTLLVPVFTGVYVNAKLTHLSHTFAIDAGFPSTGFTGASFTLNISGLASDYIWSSSNTSWVTVDNLGNVTFTGQGDSSPVTITATPKVGGRPQSYTFTLSDWFTLNEDVMQDWSNAANWCTDQGMSQPTVLQFTLGINIRGMGSLWSEWGGQVERGEGSRFWSSEVSGTNAHYAVVKGNGNVYSSNNTNIYNALCWLSL
ncbi:hypothetical protein [Yersinia hibernica]|uniref:Invasin domain-containing protein n=1 Tax=Yersinia enterocolitica LC20 TaxID=1443113 RepID=A0A7U4GGF2_YEREN|nr:hypothetical protein [Yersinia hibernica]AHM74682.1 hypothetical protein LC20_03429 [Yersinia hibernica]